MEIVVNVSERVKVLDKFYVGKVNHSALIEEDLKSSGNLSDEMKGQWVTEQFIKAAKTLHVDPFVIPVEDQGVEIPGIADLDVYEKAYLGVGSELITTISESMPLRKQAERRSRESVQQAAEWLEIAEDKLEACQGSESEAEREELANEVASAAKVHESKFTKWSVMTAGISKDIQIMEEFKAKSREKAIKQRDSDLDAKQVLINSLSELKKFLAGLMVKFPEVGMVVRQMGESSGDPYDRSDMRACYQNLLSRYRKSEAMDIATSVIVGIRDSQQGSESLGKFSRRIQEFCQDMGNMGVRHVSISDLSAIILISGMKDDLRRTFMQSETTLALTLDNIGDADDADMDDVDDQATTKSKVKSRKSLFSKVLKFVAKQEEEALLLSKLSGGSKKTDPAPSKGDAAQALKRIREAQQAFATAVVQSDARACFEFAKSGKCSKGDSCRFTHNVSSTDSATARAPGKRGHRECFNWAKTGKCSYENCRWDHPPKGPPAPTAAAPAPARSAQMHTQASPSNVPKSAAGVASVPPQSAQKPAHSKPASRVLFTQDLLDEDESTEENVDVVLVQAASEAAFATGDQLPQESQGPVWLGWDSMSSLDVAKSLDLLQDPVALRKRNFAVGMGGAKPITHKGLVPMFGKTMSYIEGGGTPNLLSVGNECKADASGLPGMVLFSANGAVRFRVTPELMDDFVALVDKADSMDLVRGKAVRRGNVYQEAFGPSGPIEPEIAATQERSQESAYAVSHSMFASRIRLDSVDQVLDFMVASGLNEQALLTGLKNQSLRGLPPAVTEEHVKQYFKYVGKPPEQLQAEIAKAPLRKPIDYETEDAVAPGAVLLIDNVDPSFSRMASAADTTAPASDKNFTGLEGTGTRRVVVPSVGGYKDAVIAIDEASGYAHLVGRVTKKDPHKIVALFAGKWKGRWGNLAFLKADQEFVTTESVALMNAYGVRIRQAVPGDHRRTTSMIEGCIRWILELAQANMNRLRGLIKDKIITERQGRTLWYHALRQAVFVFNLRPALNDPSKTRYEVGTGDVANLSYLVLMPYGLRIMGKNLLTSADGRGSEAIYIGPSSTVRGGILTYNPATERVSIKYAFMPIKDVRRPTEPQVRKIGKQLYGGVKEIPVAPVPPTKVVHPGWEDVSGFDSTEQPIEDSQLVDADPGSTTPSSVQPSAPVPSAPAAPDIPLEQNVPGTDLPVSQALLPPADLNPDLGPSVQEISPSAVSDVSDLPSPVVRKSGGGFKSPPVVSEYNTRKRASRVMTVEEKAARPPKPQLPSPKECEVCPRWIAAEVREVSKLIEEDTTTPLPIDATGRYVRPNDAIVLRLIKIREWKWKADPETGVPCWLECVRIVCDGSKDNRPESFYAETPDRTLLFLMSSIEASLGIAATGSDVTRAYLNAASIDRNIVILAPKGMRGFPRESLLNKGLYGSKGGALSWQVWIDGKMRDLDFRKLEVCRGVYLKRLPSNEAVRAYRHSDDFRMSSADVEGRILQERLLKEIVRMSEFSNIYRFLGCTFEYINALTGMPDPAGTIVLVRQTDKIREMDTKFAYLRLKFNKKNRVRQTAIPVDAIKFDEELGSDYVVALCKEEIEVYQSLGGCIQWVTGSTRHDAKLGAFLLSTRMAKPRMWDMFLAVYVMDYLSATAEAPLVLGGPIIDPVIYADASFASLPERRSIMGHCAFTGEGSGAIYATVGSTKTAVTSIWEAELMSGCAAIDTGLYVTNACNELEYEVPQCRKVRVDNQGEIDWIKGSVSNKRSRHIDVRYYRSRQMQEMGRVDVEHVVTEDNVADILTKPLVAKPFLKFARRILGHCLVFGKGIAGIFEEDPVRG